MRSGWISRTSDLVFLRRHYLPAFLGAVLAAALLAVVDTLKVEGAADDMVAHTRKVFDAAAADQHDGVFLQVVAFAADVSPDFVAIGQADAGNLTKSRVRLLRGLGGDLDTDTALKRRRLLVVLGFEVVGDTLQRRRFTLRMSTLLRGLRTN